MENRRTTTFPVARDPNEGLRQGQYHDSTGEPILSSNKNPEPTKLEKRVSLFPNEPSSNSHHHSIDETNIYSNRNPSPIQTRATQTSFPGLISSYKERQDSQILSTKDRVSAGLKLESPSTSHPPISSNQLRPHENTAQPSDGDVLLTGTPLTRKPTCDQIKSQSPWDIYIKSTAYSIQEG
ncbi:hypothetical protein L873DRAFT_1791674 [Choiromyces venosus 120613-1]|uniref:Uncharacterized protein n=1 Tax=Choiromyces venosus 120613-1 TaxID=1336337 RepID=A0A3N4JH46_9PEZI|nr:hypothetical protein L873DRAFT_1791674 [Choiromyces venosus 120613-1]